MKILLTILLAALSLNVYAIDRGNTSNTHEQGSQASQIILSCDCDRKYDERPNG